MLSFINITCPACGSVYTLSIEELNVVALFKCFECEQHNVYVAGHVLELDQGIMTGGTEKEKKRHVVETLQVFACEFAGNVLGNVERVVNVNVEMDLQAPSRRKRKRAAKKREPAREISGTRLFPSVKQVDAPKISIEEVRDFLKIDLHLIDKKSYFDKFFGDNRN